MADSFLKNGAAWGSSSVFVGPTNDGADTTILPLEDVTGPPKQDYDLANIVAQWQPNLVVIYVAPRGNQPMADAPLPRQDYRERENGIQWQQNWGAQRRAPVAAWNFADPIPRQDYRELENGIQWQQSWSAQRAAPNASWNIAVAAADNPPPLKAYPPQVNAAWQPNLVLINVPPKNGGSVEQVDNPPPRQDFAERVIAAQWQTDWSAQKADPIAGLITPAAPPADNPPPRQEYAEQRVAALWQQSWGAQRSALNAGWNFTAGQADNPPPLKPYPQQVNAAWQPNLVVISVPPKSGASVAQVDDPPLRRPYLAQLVSAHFGVAISITVRAASGGVESVDEPPRLGHAWLTIVSGQWQQEWRAQRSAPNASWNFAAPDNPPPRQEYRERENGVQWAQSWGAQRAAPVAGWTVPPAQVDNPPPRQLFGLREVVVQWQQSWAAQRPAPNAGWNFTLPDNPPPRQAFGVREVGPQWQLSWGVQHAAPNAGWNIPPIDNPPGRRPALAAGVHAAWIVSWNTQRAGPAIQEAPAVVPVYGWGARSKVGSKTGRDPFQHIGSGTATAQNGKIGSEDA